MPTGEVTYSAQRRPGHQPRRHCGSAGLGSGFRRVRSTKAGASAPATLHRTPRCPDVQRTLNEGRGISPGDTRTPLNEGRGISPGAHLPQRPIAQRRPGHQPRRHRAMGAANEGRGSAPATPAHGRAVHALGTERSTKAGASAPATLQVRRSGLGVKAKNAQRRPGHQPRRHSCRRVPSSLAAERSTKAGASAPATREDVRSDVV